jgi:nitrous oxidase accessory protein
MHKKKKTMLTLILVIVSFSVIFSGCIQQEKKQQKQEKISLQQLINNAQPGDIIYLPSQTYTGTITINKPLKLIGEDKHTTIIDGDYGETVIHIKADGVTVTNLTVRNSGGYLENSGIKIESDDNLIKNCLIYRTKTGIYLDNGEDNTISNCFFHTNSEGIYSKDSSKNIVKNCQFCHNAFGIHTEKSSRLTIEDSYVHTNGLGVYSVDTSDSEITHCSVSDNNQDGGGIWFYNCKNFDIYDCNIDHNGIGIKLIDSDSKISYCNLHRNMYNTIKVKNSENTVIQNCDIRNSYRTAIIVKESNCNLNNNNIVGNKLYALKYESDSCNARENWWGSITGPSYINSIFGDRITINKPSLKIFPWNIKPHENAGSTWDTKQVFTKLEVVSERFKPIKFNETDTDADGCPDWWEEKWDYNPQVSDNHKSLDPDNDGLNNIEECYTDSYGSDPFYKDLFLEVDWLECKNPSVTNRPPDDLIEKIKNNFKKHDINLHVDIGNLGGGEEIQYYNGLNPSDLRDLYWEYFLHNDLDNPRKGIFHYALVLNDVEELYGDYGGFVFFGWDNLDTIVLDAQKNQEWFKRFQRGKIIVSGIMHELGHTLGLIIDDYGGIDNDETYEIMRQSYWKYRNYKSCMNYRYTFYSLDYSDGTHGRNDYNDWKNLDLTFFKNTHFNLPSK